MNQNIVSKTSTLESIQIFLDRFREILLKNKPYISTEGFKTDFVRFRDEYLDIKTKSEQRQMSEAPQYNIFNILGVSRFEVRTHSAFLCDLLSPRSSHGQGLLFLKTFLEHYASRNPFDFPRLPEFDEPRKWQVFRERDIGYGRIDIVIQNPQEGFICIIENKVDANEGWNQLERYGKWLKSQELKYPDSALCYLTIKGSSSFTVEDHKYFRISYHEDIVDWLEDVCPQIQAPSVEAVVRQYQAIAYKL